MRFEMFNTNTKYEQKFGLKHEVQMVDHHV